MTDFGLLGAIAQWVTGVGVPALFLGWYNSWMKIHDLRERLRVLESMELNKIQPMLTEIRIIVGELKVRIDYQARGLDQNPAQNRRAGDT